MGKKCLFVDKDQEKMIDYKAVIEAAEQLYQDYKVQELYDYLVQFKDCTNDEVLWRLARATTDKGKDSTDAEVKKSCMFEAFEYAKRALQINENNFACHKVYKIDFFFFIFVCLCLKINYKRIFEKITFNFYKWSMAIYRLWS